MEENKDKGRNEIYSERVRAGKRTYFFDIKSTRSNDYYLTITESKRRYKEDGFVYEKHKIFLYKEDFEKFVNALNASIDHVKTELLPGVDFNDFQFNHKSDGDNAESAETAVAEESTPEASDDGAADIDDSNVEVEAEATEGTENSDLKWD